MILINKKDSQALKEYIKDILKKGYIWQLKLLARYVVIIVLKKDNNIKPYIDY